MIAIVVVTSCLVLGAAIWSMNGDEVGLQDPTPRSLPVDPGTSMQPAAQKPRGDDASGAPRAAFRLVRFGGNTLTPGQQVDALTRSGSAEDAFRAFEVLSVCAGSRNPAAEATDPNAVPDVPGLCEGITSSQLSMRYSLIQQALRGHVEGAATLAQQFAPDGRSVEAVGNDPAYGEWKRIGQLHLEEAANTGDAMALMQMAMRSSDRSSTDFDARKAITYWTALADKLASNDPRYVGNPKMLLELQAETRSRVDVFGQGLSEETVGAAVSAGHGLAALRP